MMTWSIFWLHGDRTILDENPKKESTGVISWIENAPQHVEIALDKPAGALHLNPILENTGNGLQIKWPTPGYKKEYSADMHYLSDSTLKKLNGEKAVKTKGGEQKNYFKNRILLDTPPL